MNNQLYDYWPVVGRPAIRWPDEARLAVWVGINIEHYEVDKVGTAAIYGGTAQLAPDPLNYGWRDYAVRVGIWRMMEVLDRCGLRASVLLNSDVCRCYPEIIEEGNRHGWAWLAHGRNNSSLEAGMSRDEERAYLAEVVETVRRSTGRPPRGWLGPALTETFATPELLAEQGLTYLCDWCSDDQPFPLRVPGRRMISLPYSIEVNDICLFVGKSLSGPDFRQLVIDQFETLYEQSAESGQVFSLGLHPFVIGQPFRLKYLAQALEHIVRHRGVWLATSDEIADWYLAHHYDDAVACIEERGRRYGG